MDYTELLERDYRQIAGHLIEELRMYENMTDEEIYYFLESFF